MQLSFKHRLIAAGRAVLDVVPFQVNKYIRMGLSLFITLLGFAISVDWTQFFSPEKAGAIVCILGIIKFAYNSFAPGIGMSTIPTTNTIVTQKATTTDTQKPTT